MEVKEARMKVENGEGRLGTATVEAYAVGEKRKSERESMHWRNKQEG